MKQLVHPDIFGGRVIAFFTGKNPGADLSEISRLAGIAEKHIYMPVQKHTDKVVVLDAVAGPVIADAVITNRKDILIGVQVADCVPVLLYDGARGVIGAVHAGWRGTASGILKNAIRECAGRFRSNPEDIRIAIGPSIKICCYEVDPDVARAVEKATGPGDYISHKGSKYHIDLPKANRIQAISEGVKKENISISEDCTFCNPDKYCSYRYSKGTTCRQGGFIRML